MEDLKVSSYYEFEQAKVAIMRELQKRDWTIFGHKEDESDSMTDYWSPESWSGIAEKNGYVVVVNCHDYDVKYRSGKIDYSRKRGKIESTLSERDQRLVKALKEMTQERGATAEEERSALEKLNAIFNKEESKQNEMPDIHFPKFQANPGRCSWHVEKDGRIVVKGTGIAKFSDLYFYTEEYDSATAKDLEDTEYNRNRAKKRLELWQSLNKLINKIDTAAGSIIGNSDYEFRTVTEIKFKHKNIAVERESGTMQDGATFIVKGQLGYNRNRGNVYRFHKHDGYWTATQMNKALTKEKTGNTRGIEFGRGTEEQYQMFFDRGIIAWCDIKDNPESYEVEKIVKSKKKTA